MFGTILGGYAGSYIPLLWGNSGFSFAGILFGALGSIVGIIIGFNLGE